jgi:predicted ATPase
MRKLIITGGPNAGKSTIIDLLSASGYPVLRESSRLIIEEMGIFPWDDQTLFCEVFRQVQVKRERELNSSLTFLDRSLIDPVAYAEVAGVMLNEDYYRNIEEAMYERKVFFLEMLPHYVTDKQRKDSPEIAATVHERLREVYIRLGFHLIDVPLFSGSPETSKRMRLEHILRNADLSEDGTTHVRIR